MQRKVTSCKANRKDRVERSSKSCSEQNAIITACETMRELR